MNALQLAEKVWPYALVAAPGLLAVWRSWQTSSEAKRRDKKDLIQIAQAAAGAVIEELRQETERLRERLAEVEAELTKLRKDHAEMQALKDARITLLEGEKRQLEQHIQSLEDLLVRNNIPVPKQSQPYWESREGRLEPRGLGG